MADKETAQLAAMQAAALKGSDAFEEETQTKPQDDRASSSPRKPGERKVGYRC